MSDVQYHNYQASDSISQMSFDGDPGTDDAPLPMTWTPPIEDNLTTMETKNYSYTIEPGSTDAQLFFMWDEGDLNVTVISPDGTTEDLVPADSSVSSYWQNPEPGTWTLQVTPRSISENGTKIFTQTFYGNPLLLTVDTGVQSFSNGSQIPVIAYLGMNSTGISDATVSAEVFGPDNTTDSLTLYDDGLHNDNQSSDGTFANNYTNTQVAGIYTIVVNATGSYNGESFARQAETHVWVEEDPDLQVADSDIWFSNDTPISGQQIDIHSIIHNIGAGDAPNTSVLFYDGSPSDGNLINTSTADIPAGGDREIVIPWNTTSGTRTITVIVSPFNEFMESDYSNNQAAQNITVLEPPLVADFTADITNGIRPLTVTFTDTSAGSPDSWNWSFGDMTFSTLQNPVHIYTTTGIYTVSLNVTNADQNNTTIRKEYISVSDQIQIVPSGGTVYIGESGLNISTAMATNTTLAWWPSDVFVGVTAPSKIINVTGREHAFSVSPDDFVGYTGAWSQLCR